MGVAGSYLMARLKNSEHDVTLFDLEKDPHEEHNIATENPVIVNSMEEILKTSDFCFLPSKNSSWSSSDLISSFKELDAFALSRIASE